MKADLKTLMIIIGIIADLIVGNIVYKDLPIEELKGSINSMVNSIVVSANEFFSPNNVKVKAEDKHDIVEEKETVKSVVEEEKVQENIVYDGMTLDELADKLNRSLGFTLTGTGYQFASRCIELGVDPYMAVAIVLEETGCAFGCSELVNQCYNVGGQKGAPGCWGGEYRAFSSLDEGINGFIDNLYYNYVSRGLTTPELINPVYAENPAWASNVNAYIDRIKSR